MTTPEAIAPAPQPTNRGTEPPDFNGGPGLSIDDVGDGPDIRTAALPPMPRALELRAPESWAGKIKEVGGPLAERDEAINAALQAQAVMTEGLEALEQARQLRDPRKGAHEHLEAVRAGYDRLLAAGARRRDAAIAAIDARERALQAQVDALTALTPSDDVADIRQALKAMTPEKRSEAVHRALQTGDTAVLAAILAGREMTTGLSDVTRRSIKRRFEESKMPGLHGLRTAMQQARELVAKSFDELEALDDKVLGPSQALEEFNRSVQAADQAWFALSRKLEG
jgi:hypothetical protein